MFYYQLYPNLTLPGVKYLPYASGHTVKNAEIYFNTNLLDHFTFLNSPPLFDYFSLISISKKGPNESALLDFYDFAGTIYPRVNGYLISDRFKKILDQFTMPPNTMFYPAKLMFHGEKLDYFIFQYTFNYLTQLDYINSTWQYSNSKYGTIDLSEGCTELDFKLKNIDHYHKHRNLDIKESYIILKEAYFLDYVDLLYVDGITNYAISEPLKDAIEIAKITPALVQPSELINFHFHNGTP